MVLIGYTRLISKHLERIAIDAVSFGRGHHYRAVALGLATDTPVFVGDGKSFDALEVGCAWMPSR